MAARGFFTAAVGVLLAAGSLGCSSDAETGAGGGGGGGGGEPTASVLVDAAGVTLREVVLYQGVRRSIMLGGALAPSTTPIVPGRAAMLRVFYDIQRGGYDGSEVTARLTWADGEVVEATRRLGLSSTDQELLSTFQFDLPATRVAAGNLDMTIELLQTRTLPEGEPPPAQVPGARWSSGGPIEVSAASAPFRVKLVPFRYDADGSGRVPDTSPPAVEEYRARIAALFPVSEVDVTVRDAVPWETEIDARGDGWDTVLDAIYDVRAADQPEDDVYYYGIFDPQPDFGTYCRQGCILGLTYLNDWPANTGSVDLRMAVGIGYVGLAHDTAVHELGHAMGRGHAPCGGPEGVDRTFPHTDGSIGQWAFEAVTLTPHSPGERDFMGYCDPAWVSEYTWSAIGRRVEASTLVPRLGPSESRAALRLRLDARGAITSRGTTRVDPRAFAGSGVAATVIGKDGARTTHEARVLRFDHLEGATVLLPGIDATARRVELVLDGHPVTLEL